MYSLFDLAQNIYQILFSSQTPGVKSEKAETSCKEIRSPPPLVKSKEAEEEADSQTSTSTAAKKKGSLRRKKPVSTSPCSEEDIRPPYSFISLIALSILSSYNKMLKLGEICVVPVLPQALASMVKLHPAQPQPERLLH